VIVVFGAIGVDIVATVARIPQPGETMLSPHYDVVPGTKGANQSVAAARAGSKVHHVGTCGSDPFGVVALSLMKESNIDLTHVVVSAEPTGICLVTVDQHGENTVVAVGAANLATTVQQLADCQFGSGDILLVQREIRDDETFAGVRLAKSRGAVVIFNIAPAGPVPEDLLSLVDVLVVNEHELAVVAEAVGIVTPDLKAAARAMSVKFGCSVIVTLGREGAIGWDGGNFYEVPALPVTPVDTTAAGDSFTGAFAAALDQGMSFATALARGVTAGSISCTRPGAQPSIPTKLEIDEQTPHVS
jgi:ribokinase